MRMGLSGLNAHRKKYNFIADGHCMYCNYRCENLEHFLLYCPNFAAHRQVMLDDMNARIPQVAQPITQYAQLNNKKYGKELCNILIFGTRNENFDKIIFQIVQTLYLIQIGFVNGKNAKNNPSTSEAHFLSFVSFSLFFSYT